MQERLNDELTELADRLQMPLFNWYATGPVSTVRAAHGKFEEAYALIERALEWGALAGQADADAQAASNIVVIESYRGNAQAAIADTADNLEWARPVHVARSIGRPVAELVEKAFTVRWGLITLPGLIDELQRSPDPVAAQRMLTAPRVTDNPYVLTPGSPSLPSTWYTGVLHSVIGDHNRADADMESAFALESTRDTPPLLARVRIDWAEVKLN